MKEDLTTEELKQQFINNFGEEKWNQQEMLEQLSSYENIIINELVLERLPIIVEVIDEDSRLDIKNSCIILSNKSIQSLKESIKCIAHEYRHYYQIAIVGGNFIEHPLFDVWKESLTYYNETSQLINTQIANDYLSNPLEIDAFAYTKYFFKKYLKEEIQCFSLEMEEILNMYINKYINNGL